MQPRLVLLIQQKSLAAEQPSPFAARQLEVHGPRSGALRHAAAHVVFSTVTLCCVQHCYSLTTTEPGHVPPITWLLCNPLPSSLQIRARGVLVEERSLSIGDMLWIARYATLLRAASPTWNTHTNPRTHTHGGTHAHTKAHKGHKHKAHKSHTQTHTRVTHKRTQGSQTQGTQESHTNAHKSHTQTHTIVTNKLKHIVAHDLTLLRVHELVITHGGMGSAFHKPAQNEHARSSKGGGLQGCTTCIPCSVRTWKEVREEGGKEARKEGRKEAENRGVAGQSSLPAFRDVRTCRATVSALGRRPLPKPLQGSGIENPQAHARSHRCTLPRCMSVRRRRSAPHEENPQAHARSHRCALPRCMPVRRRRSAPHEEYVLEFVVERKSVSDLLSSIQDGSKQRFQRQKWWLTRCELRQPCYLLEGDATAQRLKGVCTKCPGAAPRRVLLCRCVYM